MTNAILKTLAATALSLGAVIAVPLGFVSGVIIGAGIVEHYCLGPSKFATTVMRMSCLASESAFWVNREELWRHLRGRKDGWGEPFVVTFTGDKVVVASKHADDESLGSKRFCLRREFAIVPVSRPPQPQGD